jgi:hypothetical protein
MEENSVDSKQDPCHPLPARTYTGTETFLHNLPYLLMTILGAAVLFHSLAVAVYCHLSVPLSNNPWLTCERI